jgi:hypothetical protein
LRPISSKNFLTAGSNSFFSETGFVMKTTLTQS